MNYSEQEQLTLRYLQPLALSRDERMFNAQRNIEQRRRLPTSLARSTHRIKNCLGSVRRRLTACHSDASDAQQSTAEQRNPINKRAGVFRELVYP